MSLPSYNLANGLSKHALSATKAVQPTVFEPAEDLKNEDTWLSFRKVFTLRHRQSWCTNNS